MSKSKYYKILGLEETASQTEVRRAFRKLVMKYHPDKNPSDDAAIKFIAVTEAYEILTGKRSAPEIARSVNRATKKETNEDERKRRTEEGQKRYEEQKYREFLENELYYRRLTTGRLWKGLRISAFVGVFLTVLLIADYILPHHYTPDRVSQYSLNRAHGTGGDRISLIEMKSGDRYWITRITYSLYAKYPDVFIESSWIFHNPIRVVSREKLGYKYFEIEFNFYRHSWLLIALFLTPMYTVYYRRKKISFTVLYHFSYYFVNTVMILYILTGDRWAHILTLGFI